MAHGELAGNEVLELTSFAEKKAWIDGRIEFLSTQSPVDVATPLPPATAAVSEPELEAWWTEHDRIEEEVEAYDMGDLARMRAFARDKSKQALSPRDTDLIEITLSTIFAIDKLLHLLRQRRRSLALLRYRIHWESALALAWSRHKRIVEVDLPTLLGYICDAGPADMLDAELANSLGRSVSLSASTSSRSLAASASSRELSASGGSSRNRDQLVALAKYTLETDVRTLTSSLVPAAASALDKLIHATPSPLPEPFLDEQDRLESTASALADGLDRFIDDLMRQDRAVESLRASTATSIEEARHLANDATAATSANGVDQAVLQDLTARLASLDERLDEIQMDLRQIPRPRHPAAPNQPEANASLVGQLTAFVQTAASSRASAREAIGLYERRVEVTFEVLAALDKLQARTARLRDFLAAQSPLSIGDAGSEEQGWERTRPQEASPYGVAAGCSFPGVADDIEAAARAPITVIPLVNRARDAGVARELVRTLKQASAELAAQGQLASPALEIQRTRLDETLQLEESARSSRLAEQRLKDASAGLKAALDSALWTSGAPAEAKAEHSTTAFFSPDVEALLSGTSASFLDDNNKLRTSARATLEQLMAQRDVVERARGQSAAVDDVLRELGVIRAGLYAFASSDGHLQPLHEEFTALCHYLHTRVPFLSGVSAVSSFPEVDFEAHDARIRNHLNDSIAVLATIFAQRLAEFENRVVRGDDEMVSNTSEPPRLDLFSPTTEPSLATLPATAEGGEQRALDLIERLEAFATTRWLAPGAVQLPLPSDAYALEEELQSCQATFDSLYTPPRSEAFQRVDDVEMRQRLETAETVAARVRKLAAFAGELSRADAALSDLLIYVNESHAGASSSARTTTEPSDIVASTAQVLATLRRASQPCDDDRRVRVALRRVETTYESLLTMSANPVRSTSSLSTQSSRSSWSMQQTERPTNATMIRRAASPGADALDRVTIGITSERFASPNEAEGLSPRVLRTPRTSRAVKSGSASTTVTPFSFDTPSHRAPKHLARNGARTPATRLFQGTPRDRPTQSSIAQKREPGHSQLSSMKKALSPRPASKSSMLTPLKSSTGRRQSARHTSSNTLQAAVSAVMEQLPFVSIEVANGRFTKESGVYLIGGRTCFLRLLASKQVMVRVGGGWLELSQFIVTHFSKDDVLTVSPSRKLQLSRSAEHNPESQRLGLSLSASLRSIDEYLQAIETSPSRRPSVLDSSSTARRRPDARSSSDAVSKVEHGVLRQSTGAQSTDGRSLRPKLPVWRP